LLGGARVHPRKLEVVGYRFEYPRLDDALHALMNQATSAGALSAPR
jgi:NAD dependent epimerase/dehydratase family enzyme